MLFITGLLTLLAIAQAGGDHVKGGSRIKGGSVSQEKVAQEDIIPSAHDFSIKTGAPYGTKVTRVVQQHSDDHGTVKTSEPSIKTHYIPSTTDPVSKTAHAPSLHHSVKTLAGKTGKRHSSPALHHTVKSPVAQDQITIDDPTSSSGIKTVKTATSGKTSFSQQDPVVQVRDSVARPVIQTVQTADVPIADAVKSVKTLKTAARGKTRFSQGDAQARDPVAHPVIQTVQSTDVPIADAVKFVKTLKTAARGKTRFSQVDTQMRDTVPHPVVQTIKTAQEPVTKQSVKTVGKTVQPSSLRTKTAVKTAQPSATSQKLLSVPESIVASRRNTITGTTYPADQPSRSSAQIRTLSTSSQTTGVESQFQGGISSINERSGITLDEETLRSLQEAGGIVTENGEIALNDIGFEMLKSMRGALPHSSASTGRNEGTSVRLNMGTTDFGQRQRPNSQNARLTTSSRGTTTSVRTISRSNSLQPSSTGGGISSSTQSLGPDNSLLTLGQIQRQGAPGSSSGIRNNIRTNTRVTTETIQRGVRPTGDSLRRVAGTGGTAGILTSSVPSGVRGQTAATRSETVLFNGKEINIAGLREGQIFDENLQPISPGGGTSNAVDFKVSSVGQNIQPATRTVTRNRQQTVFSTAGAPKPVQRRPASRQRKPQAGTVAGYTQSIQTNTQRQSSIRGSGVSTRITDPSGQLAGAGVGGGMLRAGGVAAVGGQTTTRRSETVLFNGKEIDISGVREGQLFDENLQPISPGGGTSNAPDVKVSGISQNIQPATRTVMRSRQQTVSTIAGAPKPVQTRPAVRQRMPQTGAVTSYTQTIQSNTQRQSGARGSGLSTRIAESSRQTAGVRGAGALMRTTGGSAGIAGPTTATRSETVLFNGKEINISGVREGQLFDANLQPISPGGGNSNTVDIKPTTLGQNVQPASRTVVRNRQQTVSTIAGAPKPVQRRPASRQRKPAGGAVAGYTQTGYTGTGISGGQLRTTGATAGVGGQTTTTARSQTVLFDGKEINIAGLKEGQLFDENLQPIGPGGGISTAAVFKPPTVSQNIQPATRTVMRSRQQTVSTIAGAPKPVQARPALRQRTPQAGAVTGYTQTIQSNTQRQSNIRGSGVPTRKIAGVRGSGSLLRTTSGSAGTGGQTTATRSETVLFNGKEINIAGVREGQLFDENLQPISPGGGISNAVDFKTSTVGQNVQPATRTVIRNRQQTVSTIAGAPKPVQRRPASRQRKPESGVVSGYTQTIQSNTQRQPSIRRSGGSTRVTDSSGQLAGARVGGGILRAGGVGGQTTRTSSETVLFNGKEINISGVREGQLFDENLQPISPGGGTSSAADVKVSGISQNIQPATRTVMRSRQQTVSSVAGAPKPVQTRPISRQRKPQAGAVTGYTQTNQRQSGIRGSGLSTRIIDSSRQPTAAGISGGLLRTTGGAAGVGRQTTTTTRSQTALFNGKEINIAGLKEGQLFDENLQPIGPGGRVSSSADVKVSGIGQTIQPATRTVMRSRQQTTSPVAGAPKAVQLVGAGVAGGLQRTGGVAGVGGQTTTTRSETVLFNGKEINISGVREGQLFDENLQPILPGGGSPSTSDVKLSGITQNIQPGTRTIMRSRQQTVSTIADAPKPVQIRPAVRQRMPQTGAVTSYTQTIQSNAQRQSGARGSGLSTRITESSRQTAGVRGAGALVRTTGGSAGITGPTTATRSETVLFNGKEINISGVREGQLFDENLQHILPGGGTSNRVDVSQNLQPGTRTVVRNRPQSLSTVAAVPKPVQSRPVSRQRSPQVGPVSSYNQAIQPNTRRQSTIRGSAVSTRITEAGGISSSRGGGQTVGRTETLLFNGKEINIGGFKEGQLFDENLQPIVTGGLANAAVSSTSQRFRNNLRNAALPQTSSAAVSRAGTSAVRVTGVRSQSTSYQNSGARAGTIGSLGYIDVTRTRGSDVSPSTSSIGNPSTISKYSSSYGSAGTSPRSRISQDRISQDSVEASLIQQRQETPFSSVPDQQKIHDSDLPSKIVTLKAPSDPAHHVSQKTTIGGQTQLKIEDLLHQPKSEGVRSVQVQEQVPFSVPESSSPGVASKKAFTRITQVSQKNIDIPTVQQKLLGGDFSEYLPKTSYLAPFNYAPPQLSASQYRVKNPIAQEQQKLEQIFV